MASNPFASLASTGYSGSNWEQEQLAKEAAYKAQLLQGTPNYGGFVAVPPATNYPDGGYGANTGAQSPAVFPTMAATRVQLPTQITARPPVPAGTVSAAAPGNPFSALMAQMNPSGFARPEASQWLQQAFSGQYMPGWGAPMAPGTPIGPVQGGPGVPNTGTGPSGISNQPGVNSPTGLLGSQLQISPEAKKLAKKLKKMRSAAQFGLDDGLKLAGSIALGAATGGSTLAGQIAGGALGGAGSFLGSNAESKALGGSIKKYRKLRDQALTASAGETGWTRTSGKWRDAAGNDLSMPQIMQQLINLGVLGG